MIDLECTDLALLPGSGVVESLDAAGVDCRLPEVGSTDTAEARPEDGFFQE